MQNRLEYLVGIEATSGIVLGEHTVVCHAPDPGYQMLLKGAEHTISKL